MADGEGSTFGDQEVQVLEFQFQFHLVQLITLHQIALISAVTLNHKLVKRNAEKK